MSFDPNTPAREAIEAAASMSLEDAVSALSTEEENRSRKTVKAALQARLSELDTGSMDSVTPPLEAVSTTPAEKPAPTTAGGAEVRAAAGMG